MIDLIDVPGHEDFVRAMISGATGVDGIVLVVAANESVMPQTKEHFDIARLLGLDRGIIALTKVDLVDAETRELAEEEIREYVEGTFLEDAPLIGVSSVTGEGIEALKTALSALLQAPIRRTIGSSFYLPLDRAFNMRGFGLVVTGTMRGGMLRSGDTVEILPRGITATVRSLQNHNQTVVEAGPGQRVAVNLRGVKREDVRRGDTLATPGFLTPTRRIDADLVLLSDVTDGLKNGASVRMLIGTMEAIAKVRLLGSAKLEPGGKEFVQLRCDREIATHAGEQFLIRSYSPMRTIGGGRVLDASPGRHRRFDVRVTERLAAVAAGDPASILAQMLEEAGVSGLRRDEIERKLEKPRAELDSLIAAAAAVSIGPERLVDALAYDLLEEKIVESLEKFHAENPHELGLALGTLKTRLRPEPPEDVFKFAVAELEKTGELVERNGVLQAADFDALAGLSARERAIADEIGRVFRDAGIMPPALAIVTGADKTKRDIAKLLLDTGQLVRLRTLDRKVQLVVHAETLAHVAQLIREKYPPPSKFALSDVRDLLGSTRKYVVPLMEHFDATGLTLRMGDLRYLRGD